jgi:hypothetical protein
VKYFFLILQRVSNISTNAYLSKLFDICLPVGGSLCLTVNSTLQQYGDENALMKARESNRRLEEIM